MKIHKEGYTIIGITLLLLVMVNAGLWFIGLPWLSYIVLGISLVFLILVVQFFRNPKRNTIPDENHIIAPADGKVVVIEDTEETEFLKDKRKQISIFMSPLNVHVNRNPISGEVVYAKYHPGKYLVAWHPKSSTENERTTVVIERPKGERILFRQIAGAVARRIVMYSKEATMVNQGDEMGFIKFGSRIDVFVPCDCKIHVNIGEKTRGGETVLASFG